MTQLRASSENAEYSLSDIVHTTISITNRARATEGKRDRPSSWRHCNAPVYRLGGASVDRDPYRVIRCSSEWGAAMEGIRWWIRHRARLQQEFSRKNEYCGPLSGHNSTLHVPSSIFRFAPFWCFASTWHCRHPDAHGENSHIDISGPHTSDEVRI